MRSYRCGPIISLARRLMALRCLFQLATPALAYIRCRSSSILRFNDPKCERTLLLGERILTDVECVAIFSDLSTDYERLELVAIDRNRLHSIRLGPRQSHVYNQSDR